MSLPSSPEVRVLIALRLCSLAEPDAVASSTGLAVADVDDVLRQAQVEGHVQYRDGLFHGWGLTTAGRRHGERLLAAELDESGQRAVVDQAYEEFRAHNGELLALCTDWQLRPVDGAPVVNDHTDEGYDAACRARLEDLHEHAAPLLSSLAGTLERLAGYPPRFERALERVLAGEGDYFTSPAVDSYHTVWFELHENLLATLNIERAREGATH